jgi:hypothetical protein
VALVAPSDAQGFQAILSPGRIAAVPLHRVVQRPQPVAAQVEVKEQIELAGGILVPPDHCRRSLKLFCCRPQHARYLRLVQPDQLPRLMRRRICRPYIRGRGGGRARRREGEGRARGWHCRCWFSPCQHLTAGARHRDVDLWGRLRLACRPSGGWRRHRRHRPSR